MFVKSVTTIVAAKHTRPNVNSIKSVKTHSVKKMPNKDKFILTKSEIKIVRLICDGLKQPEIAKELQLSVKTINNHLANVYKKLRIHGVRNYATLVIWCILNDIYKLPNK